MINSLHAPLNAPWRFGRFRWLPLYVSSVLAVLGLLACGAPNEVVDPDGPPPNDPPCSCETGARRCIGKSVQVCEQESAGCSSWGSVVACPSGRCQAGACVGDCQDGCPAGLSRCGQDGSRDICRVGASGCLEWVKQDCPAGQFCDSGESQCKPNISCEATCPKGYTCRPNGVCGGGSSRDLVLDVRPDSLVEVNASGRITLNGAAPRNGRSCNGTIDPDYPKAIVQFMNKKTGATTQATLLCKDTHYDWTTKLAPGVYTVHVQGLDGAYITDLPTQSYVADGNLVVTTDLSGKVLDVKTLTASGRITLNGSAPKSSSRCSATMNPDEAKAEVEFREKTYGYSFNVVIYCRDAGYAWTTMLYPGTYTVQVRGLSEDLTDLPTQSYVADGSLVATGSLGDKALDMKTVMASGRITLNGSAPKNTSRCSATMNPDDGKAEVEFREKTYGYSFNTVIYCRDAGYAWQTMLYPGTYIVRVRGLSESYTDLPTQSYVADGSLVVTGSLGDKALDLKTVTASGRITLNGSAPKNMSRCSASMNPGYGKAEVEFREKTYGYVFSTVIFCREAGYTWTTTLYPGTYIVRVRGLSESYTDLPTQSYVADGSLVVTGSLADKALDLKTVTASGRITLNGSAPKNTSRCSASMNPGYGKAEVEFREKTYGYSFSTVIFCREAGYTWTTTLYPGAYTVRMRGLSEDYTDLLTQSYVADSNLVVTAAIADKVLDMKLIPVAGRVTLLGMPPKNGALCSKTENPGVAKAQVQLYEPSLGYRFDVAMLCRDAGYEFSTAVYPGTYSATVAGSDADFTNLPDGTSQVVPRLQIP